MLSENYAVHASSPNDAKTKFSNIHGDSLVEVFHKDGENRVTTFGEAPPPRIVPDVPVPVFKRTGWGRRKAS
jgi:hypothetical protein